MKKTIKKFFFALLVLTVLCLTLSVFASAEESADMPVDESETAVDGVRNGDINFFGSAYELIQSKSEEIFSFLAFLGTIIIAFIYRKGLLPALKNATGYVSDALKQMNTESKLLSDKSDSQGQLISAYAEKMDGLSEEIKRLSAELERGNLSNERRKFISLFDMQILLLREIFMSSSLPQYQKESLEKRIKEMREALTENETKE